MAYGDFKDLNRTTAANKVLDNKDQKCSGNQPKPSAMVYKFFDKKVLVVVLKMKTFLINN